MEADRLPPSRASFAQSIIRQISDCAHDAFQNDRTDLSAFNGPRAGVRRGR
jgi:hypothetical protein